MEKNKSDDTVSAVLSLLQPPEKKVICDPIFNAINSNKKEKAGQSREQVKGCSEELGLACQGL